MNATMDAEQPEHNSEHAEQRSSNGAERNAYQMHLQRFTTEQMENAARIAQGLHLS